MNPSPKMFEEEEAIKFGEAIKDAEINYCRDVVCEFLNSIGIETEAKHPDTDELVGFSFDEAYSVLIRKGYLLNTEVKPINRKMIFHCQIFKKDFERKINLRTGFNVELVPVTEEELIPREVEKDETEKAE